MTGSSMPGKASLRRPMFFCASVRGRGGLAGGGGESPTAADKGLLEGASLDGSSPLVRPDSCTSSSSKSRGRAVVGDSGP